MKNIKNSTDKIINGKLCDSDGKSYEFVQLDDSCKPVYGAHTHDEFVKIGESRMSIFEKMWIKICRKFHNIHDLKYKFRYALQRMYRGYDETEVWSIDYSLMKFIITRVGDLNKNHHGVPNLYCKKARSILKKEGKLDKIGSGVQPSKAEISLGDKLFRNDLKNLILNARLYLFYSDFCIEDPLNFTDGLSKKYKTPFKEIKGKNGEKVLDYDEIFKKQKESKNAVMDYLKKNLEVLWD